MYICVGHTKKYLQPTGKKKPVLVWCEQGKMLAPNWFVFYASTRTHIDSVDQLLAYLYDISMSDDTSKLRWFFGCKNINIIAPINQLGYGVASLNIVKSLSSMANVALFPIGSPSDIKDEDVPFIENARITTTCSMLHVSEFGINMICHNL